MECEVGLPSLSLLERPGLPLGIARWDEPGLAALEPRLGVEDLAGIHARPTPGSWHFDWLAWSLDLTAP